MRTLASSLLILSGILCLFYSIVVRMAGSGTRFFMVWTGIGICFLGSALILVLKIADRLPRPVDYGAGAVLVLGTGWIIFCIARIAGDFHEKGDPGLDAVIVLGAQVRESGPSRVLKYRLDLAADYLEQNPETVCIVSGGKGSNEPYSEAEGMMKYLVENGISQDRIRMETKSQNTVQNIRYSKELLEPEWTGIGIITNNFHLYRAKALAQKTGLEPVCGLAAASSLLYLPNNVLRECLGILKDVLEGNMNL